MQLSVLLDFSLITYLGKYLGSYEKGKEKVYKGCVFDRRTV